MFQDETSQAAKVIIIADDMTGALDTGVQFAKRGISVQVISGWDDKFDAHGAEVMVCNAESRHLPAEEAYARTHRMVSRACALGIPHLYIKTDSGLRGPVGAAIRAAMDASGAAFAAFAPAYPAMGRTTRGGHHYVDGVPLHHSIFAQDPFDPVTTSDLTAMLAPYVPNVAICQGGQLPAIGAKPVVAAFDIESSGDFIPVVEQLTRCQLLKVTVGCAAFAAALVDAFGLTSQTQAFRTSTKSLAVVCGSLNPVAQEQMTYGRSHNFAAFPLSKATLEQIYRGTEEGKTFLQEVHACMQRGTPLLLNTLGDSADAAAGMDETAIAERLGYLTLQITQWAESSDYTLMIIGGDTLTGFLQQLHDSEIRLESEVLPGVVGFTVTTRGQKRYMLSKSGAFGSATLLRDIALQQEAVLAK